MKKTIVALALILGAAGVAGAADTHPVIVDNDAVAYSQNFDLDLTYIKTLSVQATYSSATLPTAVFDDGRKSTGTITVANNNALTPARASVTIVISNNAGVTGQRVVLNGITFKEGAGGNWTKGSHSSATATSLATVINAHSSFDAEVTASTGVIAYWASSGTVANSYTATSSTPTAMSVTSPFSGGLDNARLTVYTRQLVQGVHWTRGTTSTATALSIHNAIRDNLTINAVIVSTPGVVGGNGVVFATATAVGTTLNAYTMVSSTPAALSVSGFAGGQESDISLTADTIASTTTNRLGRGVPLLYTTASGTAPTGLTAGTTYYLIPNNPQSFKLSDTSTGSIAGVTVNISAQTGSGSFRLTPLAFAGTPSFKWQVSNDGSSFTDLAVSSVTYSAPGSTSWDFGTVNYKTLRLKFQAGTAGATDLLAVGNGTSKRP